ncbi:MAG TPA: hypothetical protein VHH72_02105 [Solirubrobacterales bacterium]|jgi:hypothetical protein|nr:hypothetical protein [Solirubrobacterales bacterium]
MSQENVELVQSMYLPGDPSRFFNLLYEEVEAEFDASAAPLLPDYPKTIHGKTAVIGFYRHYWGTWDDYVLEPTEIIDAGEDRVVCRSPRARHREGKRGAVGAMGRRPHPSFRSSD